MNKRHYHQLDVFRALAALSVCAVHFNFDSFFHNHFANSLFVQLFFALSGFVIFLNYYGKIKNFIDLRLFIIKRFKRLYPLHLFFLIIFALLEVLKYLFILRYGHQSFTEAFSLNNFNNFLLNLFFLQHFADFNTYNTPSWSISVEMMLYVSAGILFLFPKKYIALILALYLLFFLYFLNNIYGATISINAYLSGLYSFLIGCFFSYLYIKKKIILKSIFFEFFYFTVLLIFLSEIFYFKFIDKYYLYSILFAFIFYLSCYLDKDSYLFKFIFNKFFNFLGKISYSIYLSHLFIFYALKQILRFVLNHPTIKVDGIVILDLTYFQANLFIIIAYMVTIIFSYFSYKYIEMKFYKK